MSMGRNLTESADRYLRSWASSDVLSEVTPGRGRGGRAITGGRSELGDRVASDIACGEDTGGRSSHHDVGLDMPGLVERNQVTQKCGIGLKSDIYEHAVHRVITGRPRGEVAQPHAGNAVIADDLLDPGRRR